MSKRKIPKYTISSSSIQVERIDSMLKQLELETMRAHFKKLAEEIKNKNGTLFDYFEALLEQQVVENEARRIDRWNQAARFALQKTLQEFDFTFPKKIDQVMINELSSCQFILEKRNVLFLGPTGVGKTHLACALGKEAISKGFETKFFSLREIIHAVKKEIQSRGSFERLLNTLSRIPLLIIDEIEYEKVDSSTNESASDFLYQLLRNRYENNPSSTIFTSNKSFEGWNKIFWSNERANKIIDRLLHDAYVVIIDGESYRTKDKLEFLGNKTA